MIEQQFARIRRNGPQWVEVGGVWWGFGSGAMYVTSLRPGRLR